jgi:hypothetical protein
MAFFSRTAPSSPNSPCYYTLYIQFLYHFESQPLFVPQENLQAGIDFAFVDATVAEPTSSPTKRPSMFKQLSLPTKIGTRLSSVTSKMGARSTFLKQQSSPDKLSNWAPVAKQISSPIGKVTVASKASVDFDADKEKVWSELTQASILYSLSSYDHLGGIKGRLYMVPITNNRLSREV